MVQIAGVVCGYIVARLFVQFGYKEGFKEGYELGRLDRRLDAYRMCRSYESEPQMGLADQIFFRMTHDKD